MRKTPLAIVSATVVVLGAWPTVGRAQVTGPGQLGVRIVIESSCDISGATGGTLTGALLDFGTHSLLQSAINADTTTSAQPLQVLCTPDARYTLTFGQGLHASGTPPQNRRMASGTDFIPYELFSDAQRSTALGSIGPRDATGSLETITVYGRVPAQPGAAPPAGTYTDTVVVTLSF